jgi:hypothetical protein
MANLLSGTKYLCAGDVTMAIGTDGLLTWKRNLFHILKTIICRFLSEMTKDGCQEISTENINFALVFKVAYSNVRWALPNMHDDSNLF